MTRGDLHSPGQSQYKGRPGRAVITVRRPTISTRPSFAPFPRSDEGAIISWSVA